MDNLFKDSDLADLLTELEADENKTVLDEDPEMEAAERRYQEIIKKHNEE